MTSIAFQPSRIDGFSVGAAQQSTRPSKSSSEVAHDDCGCTDTCQAYVTRGIIYGLLISAPLWLTLGGAVYLVCHTMG